MTDGLNDYQRQALEIERSYRQQVKAANDYAKALGLSGARAQDLAKIEELRALSMGKLQAAMEADNAAFLGQLALSDLSTLRDDQKLAEAMGQLADEIEAMHEGISRVIFELAAQGEHTITAPIRAEQQRTNELLGHVIDRLDRIDGNTDRRSQDLQDALNGRHAVLAR